MTFFKRLFRRKEKTAAEPLHGDVSTQQAEAQRAGQGAARQHMETEMAADRERRGATDVPPSGEQPPGSAPPPAEGSS